MQFEIFTDAVTDLETECLILAIAPEGKLSPSALVVNAQSQGYLSDVAADHSGKAGENLLLHKVPGIKAKRVVLMGVANRKIVPTVLSVK